MNLSPRSANSLDGANTPTYTRTMALQLTPALEQRLEYLAAQTHRSPEELAEEGMDRFLYQEEQIQAAVKRGRADIAAGRFVEHEEAVAFLDRILAEP